MLVEDGEEEGPGPDSVPGHHAVVQINGVNQRGVDDKRQSSLDLLYQLIHTLL